MTETKMSLDNSHAFHHWYYTTTMQIILVFFLPKCFEMRAGLLHTPGEYTRLIDQLSAFESGLQLNYSFHKIYLYFSYCISPFSLFSNYVFSITSNLFCTAQKGKYLKQFLVTCLHVSISFANCKSGMC